MKRRLKKLIPAALWSQLRAIKHRFFIIVRRILESFGFIVIRKHDLYAAIPSEKELNNNRTRWIKPSALNGITYDLDKMENLLVHLCNEYLEEFESLPPYSKMIRLGFGLGYPQVDAFFLYSMLRHVKPKQYLEIGSGLSTAYAQKALSQDKNPDYCAPITCVEPFPFNKLCSLPGITLIQSEAQNIPADQFESLGEGDVLFIDSSHSVRIDGEVPYLFLEVLPQLASGVLIHIHDIPFPYNIPYPPEYWTLLEHRESPHWPMFWNEAMLLQAFLSGNTSFEIVQSLPMLRFYRETTLRKNIPFYKSVREEPNTFSSIWIKKK